MKYNKPICFFVLSAFIILITSCRIVKKSSSQHSFEKRILQPVTPSSSSSFSYNEIDTLLAFYKKQTDSLQTLYSNTRNSKKKFIDSLLYHVQFKRNMAIIDIVSRNDTPENNYIYLRYLTPLIDIGDKAPPLKVTAWLKGTPVEKFEKGKVYVIAFWATWCRPCRAEISHLSALANQYKKEVTVIGMNMYEYRTTSQQQVQDFVDKMDTQMNYTVGMGDSTYMTNAWLNSTAQITSAVLPGCMIINQQGKLAWIGHPCDNMEEALEKIVHKTWNIDKALQNRINEFRVRNMEDSLSELLQFDPVTGKTRNENWKKDSSLLLIKQIEAKEPLLLSSGTIALSKFSYLLQYDLAKACEYGNRILSASDYKNTIGNFIHYAIENSPDSARFTDAVYQLGIRAINTEIKDILSCLPEIKNVSSYYYKMAEWYYRIQNKEMAVACMQNAIRITKEKDKDDKEKLAAYEMLVKKYSEP